MNNKILFIIGILGVTLFVVASLLGGYLMENYDPMTQYISESMATGTAHSKALRYYGYIPAGLLLTVFAILAPRKFPKSIWITLGFLGFTLFYGIATLIVGFFPCDAGCNKELIDPSISQIIHNLTGALTYLFVPACMILIGIGLLKFKPYKRLSLLGIIGGIICFLFVGLLSDPLTTYAGLFQRVIEVLFALWIVACAFYIKRGNLAV